MKLTFKKDQFLTLAWCMLAAYAAFLIPMDALAATSVGVGVSTGSSSGLGTGSENGGAIGDILCTVVHWFTGRVGQGIATLAILVIGIGALMGKVSWGMAIIVGIGVGVIFGAPSIVEALGGTSGC